MSRKSRNSDGTLRRPNQPALLTQRSLLARWVEAETLHLKQSAIADHIVGVVQGKIGAMVSPPGDLRFPNNYQISVQAVHAAFRRGIMRLPNSEATELRKLDTERLEDLFLSLGPAIRKGDAKAVDAGVRVLAHKAKLNGYEAPRSIELGGKEGGGISVTMIQEVVNALDENKEKK
jgi:hypothetical protein